MVKVIPVSDFTGYPDGVKTQFSAGAEASVSAEYAAILREKGLVKSLPKRTKASDEEE